MFAFSSFYMCGNRMNNLLPIFHLIGDRFRQVSMCTRTLHLSAFDLTLRPCIFLTLRLFLFRPQLIVVSNNNHMVLRVITEESRQGHFLKSPLALRGKFCSMTEGDHLENCVIHDSWSITYIYLI